MEPRPFVQATKIMSTKEIGMRVKSIRKQRRFTQAQLAHNAGVGIRFLSELENGKPSLQFDKLMQVLNYLTISFYID